VKTINAYLDAALKRQNLTSLRQLSAALGIEASIVPQYNIGRMLPADDVMVKIAELAGVRPEKALIDLNTWRAKDPKVRKLYADLAKTLGIAAMMMGPPGGSPPPALAAPMPRASVPIVAKHENAARTDGRWIFESIHYATWLRSLARSIGRLFRDILPNIRESLA
jgi:hypothetical protein